MREIWVYRIGSLGDALVSLPAIHRIREHHPKAKLVLLTNQPDNGIVCAWDILQYSGVFTEAVLYRPGGLAEMWKLLTGLRRSKPQALYYLAPTRRTKYQLWRDRLFFSWLAGTQLVIGLDRAGTNDDSLPLSGKSPKESDRLLRLVDPDASVESMRRTSLLDVPAACWQEAADLLRKAGWQDGQPMIALVAGSKMATKRWPAERYKELGENLLERFPDLFIVLLGSAKEAELSQQVCQSWGNRAANLAGKTSLIHLAAILQRCLLYVGNDTGTMHLAAAVGKPCVAIFSARDEAGKWEPYGQQHRVLRVDVECAGCMKETCSEMQLKCLTRITAQEALDAVLPLLSRLFSQLQGVDIELTKLANGREACVNNLLNNW